MNKQDNRPGVSKKLQPRRESMPYIFWALIWGIIVGCIVWYRLFWQS